MNQNRVCLECYENRPILMFAPTRSNNRNGRRRVCIPCRSRVPVWPAVATFRLPALTPFGIATSTVSDRLAVILACWDSCRREGPAAMARLLHQIWEVSYQADAVLAGQLRNVVSQARAGAVSLEFARRQVEGMG